MSDTEQRMRQRTDEVCDPYDPRNTENEARAALNFLAGECDALRAENEALLSDLRQLQDAVAELTHATTKAFDNCHAAQRAYTDRAVGERPEPGSTLERMLALENDIDPNAHWNIAVAAYLKFLCDELDEVRR